VIHRQAILSVVRKLGWMEDLCTGLQYAHRGGIIHRDIKPENVMVDEGGAVKILDFGIARLGAAGLTQGGIVGTLNYMAPEQLEGLPVDARADIYSLGALFYELLSYRRAFSGGVADGILAKILYRDPKPLDQIVSDIDPQLVAVVGRCLAKKAEGRYANCLALAQDIATVRLRLEQRDSGGIDTDVFSFVSDKVETPKRAKQRVELLRIRAEEIHAHLARAQAAMARGAYDDAVRECERALVLDPGHDEAAVLADVARSALERQQIERWVADGHDELSRGALTAASLIVDRALSLNSSSSEAIALRAAVDAARRDVAETQERIDAAVEELANLETETKAARADTRVSAKLPAESAESKTPADRSWPDAGRVKTPRVGPSRLGLVAAVVALAAGSLLLPRLWRDRPEPPAIVVPLGEPPLVPSLSGSSAPSDPNANASVDSGAKPPVQGPVPPIDRKSIAIAQGALGRGQPPAPATSAASSSTGPAAVNTAPPSPPPDTTNPAERPAVPAPPPAVVPTESGIPAGAALGGAEPPPPTPAPPPSPASDAGDPAALLAADEAAIRNVLAAYESAYESLDAAAVKRVVRSLTPAEERRLADQFGEYKSYVLQIQNLSIAVAGSKATARGRVARTAVPKASRALSNANDMSFELQKDGSAWVITSLAGASSR
jgi:tetratricopeptide (TPR) repeat protein